MSNFARLAATAAVIALPFSAARADEGMWTIDAFPTARMKAAYGWAPDQAWLDKVRSAAVRLTGGCSASFVSPDGLILTNHHCVATCVEQNSDRQQQHPRHRLHRRHARARAQVRRTAGRGGDVDRRRHAPREGRDRVADGRGRGQGAPRQSPRRSRRPAAPTSPPPGARSSVCMAAASTSSTPIANIPTSAWPGRPRRRPPSSAAIPTISTSRATRWMPASCAPTKMADRSRPHSI